MERKHQPGKLGGWSAWVLTAGTHQWRIPCTSVSESFGLDVVTGITVRIRYRQGTELVTHLDIEQAETRRLDETSQSLS